MSLSFSAISEGWLPLPPVRPRTSSACWRWRGRAPRWLCPYCLSSPSLSARARKRRRTSPAGSSSCPALLDGGNTACPALQNKAELHGVGHFFLGLHVKPVCYALQVRLGAVRRHAQIQVGGINSAFICLFIASSTFLFIFMGSSAARLKSHPAFYKVIKYEVIIQFFVSYSI